MKRFYDTLAALAVILTPVAMMAAFGWTTFAAVQALTGVRWLALVSGVATAAALEAIGIVAGETVLRFHGRSDRRWVIAALIMAVYVAFGIYVLMSTPLALLPLLAGAVYVLIGLRAQAERESAAESAAEAEATGWSHEQWRIMQADRTAVKLARARSEPAESWHSAGTVLAQSRPSGHACEDCGQSFGSVQALNAHRRFCRGVVPFRSNGHKE